MFKKRWDISNRIGARWMKWRFDPRDEYNHARLAM